VLGQRFTFRVRSWMVSVLLTTGIFLSTSGCLSSTNSGGTSGGLADLIPGHQEAALRKRVEADSFPRADQALHSPLGGDANRVSNGD
jgi:hypothetical protein